MKRVGFIIDGRLPSVRSILSRRCSPRSLLVGEKPSSSVAEMRYGWIADRVNATDAGLRYELYRPFRKYDAVVFLKSMSNACHKKAMELKARGARILFDANVDYYTTPKGVFPYEGMAPTAAQQQEAIRMTTSCDAVIADSEHIAEVARAHNTRVAWIPDNVDMRLAPKSLNWGGGTPKISLLWSGIMLKMAELLVIENVLKTYANRIHLVLVTDSDSLPACWSQELKQRFVGLLSAVSHSLVQYTSVSALMDIYSAGGIAISPRFLDNTYNLGHTEWKITLPMACGRLVLCSPQRSYETVAQRAGGRGIRICRSDADWEASLEQLLRGGIDLKAEGLEAQAVVNKWYSTEVMAEQHRAFMEKVICNGW